MIYMLKISITPTTIFFDDVSDEVLSVIDGLRLEVYNAPKGYRVSATKEKLFLLLVELSRDFDVEIR